MSAIPSHIALDADDDAIIMLVQRAEALHIMRLDAKNTLAALVAACVKKNWFDVLLILHHKRLNLAPATIMEIRNAAFNDRRPDVAMAIPNGSLDARWDNGTRIGRCPRLFSPFTHVCVFIEEARAAAAAGSVQLLTEIAQAVTRARRILTVERQQNALMVGIVRMG